MQVFEWLASIRHWVFASHDRTSPGVRPARPFFNDDTGTINITIAAGKTAPSGLKINVGLVRRCGGNRWTPSSEA